MKKKRKILKVSKVSILRCNIMLLGMFCQLHQIVPKIVWGAWLVICTILTMITSKTIGKLKFPKGAMWYVVFTIYVVVSMLYTVNTINPDYVYTRMLMYLYITLLIVINMDFEKNFVDLIKGFALGGIIGIVTVVLKQYEYIGKSRLGNGIYGSYAEFGNICMLAMSSLIWLKDKMKNRKILLGIGYAIIGVGIILSGARKAILVPVLMLIFLLLFNNRKNISNKVFYLVILFTFGIITIYFTLNNSFLYKVIGHRIDSGISTMFGNNSSDGSLIEREKFKDLAMELIKQRPIFGYGIHGYAYFNLMYNGQLVYSHDNFLEILSCYGIIGFIIYYYAFIKNLTHYKIFIKNNKEEIGSFLFSYVIIILLLESTSISYLAIYDIIILSLGIEYLEYVKKIDKEKTLYEGIN